MTEERDPGPMGLGGWLLFFAIPLPLGTVYLLWAAATTPSFFAFLLATVYGIGSLLFFDRSRQFPAFIIAVMWIGVGLDWAAVVLDPEYRRAEIKTVTPATIMVAVWTSYLRRSARVRNTFTK